MKEEIGRCGRQPDLLESPTIAFATLRTCAGLSHRTLRQRTEMPQDAPLGAGEKPSA